MSDEKKKGTDPAFLFYPGDASEDTQFMNRLERGAYFDLLKAQKKFAKFTIEMIKKVLGQDFEACWPAIELVLVKDGEYYFIKWVADAIQKRKDHAAKQSERIKEYWRKKNKSKTEPIPNHGNSTELPLEIGNEIGNENTKEIKGVQGENDGATFEDYETWTEQIIRGEDQFFEQMLMKSSLRPNGHLSEFAKSYLGLLAQYPKKAPPDQNRFRHALISHIIEKLNDKPHAPHKGTSSGVSNHTGGKNYSERF
jgi:hypothetical protein